MNHQVNLQLCDECLHQYMGGERVTLLRRSHRWSFWCEHSIGEDWYPGHEPPVLMYISQDPR